MTQREMDFGEFEELKKQFGLLDEKLEKQRIISEDIVNGAIEEKLSHVETWYRNRFRTSLISAPVASIVLFAMYIDMGVEYWGLSLFVLAVGLLEYFLNRRCYKALDIDRLPSMTMTEARERVLGHERLRSMTGKIMLPQYIALIAWTILVASGFGLSVEVIAITTFAMGVSVIWGYCQQKANKRRLDGILQHIRSLRGEN
jgi:hypothetical protein